jgi:hypothetical protein
MAAKRTFTVYEDQPRMGRWGVKIRTFDNHAAAARFLKRQYTAEERDGECEMCHPYIMDDAEMSVMSDRAA